MNAHIELARLLDRVEELEGLLGMRDPVPRPLGLTPQETQVFNLLLRRDILSRAFCFEAVWGGDSETGDKILDVVIHHLRAKLKPHGISIISLRSIGYAIPAEDKARVRSLLAPPCVTTVAATVGAVPSTYSPGTP